MNMGAKTLAVLVSLMAHTLAGCARRPMTIPYRSSTHAQMVEVVGSGVSIRAEDGSFTLQPGKRMAIPRAALLVQACPVANRKGWKMRDVQATDWRSAKRYGFVPVRVTHPDSAQELYGLLGLCPISSRETGVVASGYQIQIPKVRVPVDRRETKVVWENSSEKSAGKLIPGFMLFLRQVPFDGVAVGGIAGQLRAVTTMGPSVGASGPVGHIGLGLVYEAEVDGRAVELELMPTFVAGDNDNVVGASGAFTGAVSLVGGHQFFLGFTGGKVEQRIDDDSADESSYYYDGDGDGLDDDTGQVMPIETDEDDSETVTHDGIGVFLGYQYHSYGSPLRFRLGVGTGDRAGAYVIPHFSIGLYL